MRKALVGVLSAVLDHRRGITPGRRDHSRSVLDCARRQRRPCGSPSLHPPGANVLTRNPFRAGGPVRTGAQTGSQTGNHSPRSAADSGGRPRKPRLCDLRLCTSAAGGKTPTSSLTRKRSWVQVPHRPLKRPVQTGYRANWTRVPLSDDGQIMAARCRHPHRRSPSGQCLQDRSHQRPRTDPQHGVLPRSADRRTGLRRHLSQEGRR